MKIVFTKNLSLEYQKKQDFEIKGTTLIKCNLNTEKIVVPDGVTIIGESSFEKSVAEEIVLPDGVKNIDNRAFLNCTQLRNINIPKTVEAIGDYAFCDCKKLRTMELPETLVTIGDFCFAGSGIESVNISSSVKTVGKGAFSNSNIEMIIIPESVESLGDETFMSCNNLKQIVIKGKYVNIPNSFCKNDQKLESFDFSNVITIGYCAFYECTNLHLTIIPKNVTYVGDYAFAKTKAISNLKIENMAAFSNAVGAFEDSYVKSATLNMAYGISIAAIPCSMFKFCRQLESVTFTGDIDALVKVGTSAFQRTDIREMVLPDKIFVIEDNAFGGCANLKAIKLSERLEYLKENAFSHCYNLEKIDIPDNVKTIGNSCFRYCRSLKRVKYPSIVNFIPQDCFKECTSLKSFNAEEIKVIGYGAFLKCYNLRSFMFSSVEQLGESAFAESGIENVALSDKFCVTPGKYSAQNSFYGCMNLTSVDLRRCAKLDMISTNMFMNCKNLKNISLNESITSFHSFCFYNTGIKEINFPEETKFIDEDAFACLKLDKATFSSSINTYCISIHSEAFHGSAIKELVIPEDLYNAYKADIWNKIK